MKKEKIIPKYKHELQEIISKEISSFGHDCDLNHIDVSHIKDMSYLFKNSPFNGNISRWDVSNVTDMRQMFYNSAFCGNLYDWDVSKVEDMNFMFCGTTRFYGDVSQWKPTSLKNKRKIFNNSNKPYWAEVDIEFLPQAINAYHLNKKLNYHLSEKIENTNKSAKMKV